MIVLYHKLRVFCKSDARFVWYNQVVSKKLIHKWREPLMNMTAAMEARTNKPLTACTDQEIYLALLDIVREQSAARVRPVTGRKLYYISAEFLIGKLLSNNLINLGLYDDTRAALAAAGKNLSDVEEVEPEPSLGNGGAVWPPVSLTPSPR